MRIPKPLWIFEGSSAERDALCDRLGLDRPHDRDTGDPFVLLFSKIIVWAAIGVELAKQQPEFAGVKGRGRPKLDGIDNDYRRAQYIWNNSRQGSSQADAIRQAMDSRAPLFLSNDFDALKASVSRGNKTLRRLHLEVNLLWAQEFRRDCVNFRQRRALIDQSNNAVGPDENACYGLMGFKSSLPEK